MTPPSTLDKSSRLRHPAELLLDPQKDWYSTTEASAILGISGEFVRQSFDDQTLMGHEVSSRQSVRKIKLIHRDCLLMHMLETSNYTATDFTLRVKKILDRRNADELRIVRGWIDERLSKMVV